MNLKNKKLYLILDTTYVDPKNMIDTAKECCDAGVDIIQFRDKNLSDKEKFRMAEKLRVVISKYHIPFIINDRLDIALAVDADGLHLGQDDFPIEKAQAVIRDSGKKLIIGASTHSFDQAVNTVKKYNPDYIAIGPLFPTPTKPDYIAVGLDTAKRVVEVTEIPLFGIGGIKTDNLDQIRETGLKGIAVVSAILQSNDRKKTINIFKKF